MREALRVAALVVTAAGGAALVHAGREEQAGAPAAATAVENVTLFDGTAATASATVVFDERGITSICVKCPAPKGARTIDGRGKTLLPGLIDAHTHSFLDALERALVFGVTTEIDMFTAPAFAAERRAEQQRGAAFGRADLLSAGYLVTVAGGHGTEYGLPVPTFAKGMDAQRFIDERLAEGSDFIKLVYDDGASYKLTFKSLDLESLTQLIAATKKRGKLAVVHVSTASAARDAVAAGAHGLVHVWADGKADDALFAEIARRGVFVIPTLGVIGSVAGRTESSKVAEHPALAKYVSPAELAGVRAMFPSTAHQKNALDHAKQAVRRLREQKTPLLAGTDAPNPGTAHGLSLHREMQLLVESGLTPLEALKAATSAPAATFGLKDRGAIAQGLRADLVLVEGDATVDIAATQNIVSVWKGGRAATRVERSTTDAASAARSAVTGVVSDFESGLTSAFGTSWMVSTDQMMGGKSTATAVQARAADGSAAQVMRVEGEIRGGPMFPWAGAMLMLSTTPMAAVDVRPNKEIVLRVRSAAGLRLMVFSSQLGRIPAVKNLDPAPEWTTVAVPLGELGLDGSDIQGLLVSGVSGTFAFEIDSVALR